MNNRLEVPEEGPTWLEGSETVDVDQPRDALTAASGIRI